jgi:hypothetical protein
MDLNEVRSQKRTNQIRTIYWGKRKTTQKNKNKNNVEYYGCHKKGHYKSEYRTTGKRQNKVSEVKKAVDHNSLY